MPRVTPIGMKTAKGGRLDEVTSSEMTRCLIRVGEARDRAAFEALFRHFGPRVRAYMLKRAFDVALADELMQETMMTVWRKAGQFDAGRGNASAWIFTVARNIRIDSLRRSRRPEFDPEDPALVPEAPAAPDQNFEDGQDAERIRVALATLPSEQAELLRMSFFEEIPHSMIAERMSLPLGTVKSRIRAAFSKLRYALGDER